MSTYHDTPDLRLARAGVTLRYRTGDDGGPVWTLKLRVAGSDGIGPRRADISRGARTRFRWLRSISSRALSRACALEPVATLRTRRRRWLLCGGAERELAELVDDDVTVLDGEEVRARFRELELESRGPDLDQLIPIAERLQLAGAVLAEPVPKVVRAMGPRAAAPADLAPVEVAAVRPRGAGGAGGDRSWRHPPDAERSCARASAKRSRCTRCGWRPGACGATCAPSRHWSTRPGPPSSRRSWDGWAAASARCGTSTYRSRSFEALADELRPDLGRALRPARSSSARRRGADLMVWRCAAPRYTALLDRLVEASRAPCSRAPPRHRSSRRCRHSCTPRGAASRDRPAPSAPDDPDERYHAVRILAKRARYAAEAIGPVLGGGGKRELLFAAARGRSSRICSAHSRMR